MDKLINRIMKPLVSKLLKQILRNIFIINKDNASIEVQVVQGLLTLTNVQFNDVKFNESFPLFELLSSNMILMEIKIPW